MKTTLHRSITLAALMSAALFSVSSHAQSSWREDMVRYFQMDQVDANKDHMVSKKEFMDMMNKAWEMQAEKTKMTTKDKMTLDEYRAFAKMFNLNIGN